MSEELLLGKVLSTKVYKPPYSDADQTPYSYSEIEFYLVVEDNPTHLLIVPISGRNSAVGKSRQPVIPAATLEALKAYYQPLMVNKLKDYNRQFKDPEGNVFDLYNGKKFHPLS
jgi:hypothetical protein